MRYTLPLLQEHLVFFDMLGFKKKQNLLKFFRGTGYMGVYVLQ